jgi:hypothetical protein
LITVGVPVTVQPGMDTELYPDNDGSPNSAPGLTSRFGLSTAAADAGAVFGEMVSIVTALTAPATRRKRLSIKQSPLRLTRVTRLLRRW